MPLIGQLSNRQFGIKADQLLAALDSNAPVGVDMPLCRCGCGSEVASGRKFVSQAHYDRWRSLSPVHAEQIITRCRQGIPRSQLAEEYGISLSALERLLQKRRETQGQS